MKELVETRLFVALESDVDCARLGKVDREAKDCLRGEGLLLIT